MEGGKKIKNIGWVNPKMITITSFWEPPLSFIEIGDHKIEVWKVHINNIKGKIVNKNKLDVYEQIEEA